MFRPRKGEYDGVVRLRTPRCIETQEGWFLRTREGIPVGPFASADDAESGALWLAEMLIAVNSHDEVVGIIQTFLIESGCAARLKRYSTG